MKQTWAGAVASLFLYFANPLAAQPTRELQGQIFHMGENGEKILEPGLIVTLVETGATDDANDQGIFRLPLPPAFQPGDSVTFSIDKPGWRIRFPLEGEARIPRDLQRERLPVELLQVGSKLFWTNDRIEKFIRDASERSKQEGRQKDDAPSLELGRDIKDWAAKYGFSAEEAHKEIDRWIADVEAAHEDSYQHGLAAFAKQQFDTAAERFRDSAEWRIRQLAETRKQQELLEDKAKRLQEEVVRDLRLQGDSHFYAYRFEQALAAYEQAHQYTSKEQTPQLWGATLNDIGRAHLELGIRVAAAESPAHLAAAVQAHRQAWIVFTREQMPHDWARTQNNLGKALSIQAGYAVGEEVLGLLGQAIKAHQQALLVYTLEQTPQDWALTQLCIGNVLSTQATNIMGQEGTELFVEAVKAYRQALRVFTHDQFPRKWAATQHYLGTALKDQGSRIAGEEGTQLLAQAVQAYREALLVMTREQLPQQWAQTQDSLAIALREQEARTPNEKGTLLLAQAVEAYQQALLVRTREQLPQQWAATQNNLGNALADQGARTVGEEGTQLLAQAVQAYQQALLVRTREQMPQQWARTQNNLGTVLEDQGSRTAGEEGVQLLAQAAQAYQQALLVYDRGQMPQQWALIQANLCIALQGRGMRTSGDKGIKLLEQAVDACRQALLVFTPDHFSQWWAMASSNEAQALLSLHRSEEAIDALYQVLKKVPDHQQAFELLGMTLNNQLFHHQEAIALTRSWLSRHSDDLTARLDLGEQLFALRAFSDSNQETGSLLKEPKLTPENRIVALAYAIAAGLAMNSPEVSDRFEELLRVVAAQPQDFKISWTFEGALHSLGEDPEVPHKDLLIRLFQAFAAPNRDDLLAGLREVKEDSRDIHKSVPLDRKATSQEDRRGQSVSLSSPTGRESLARRLRPKANALGHKADRPRGLKAARGLFETASVL